MSELQMITAESAQKLLDAASPGPWEVTRDHDGGPMGAHWIYLHAPNCVDENHTGWIAECDEDLEPPSIDFGRVSPICADAELAAAAPNLASTVIHLSDQVDKVRELIAQFEEHNRWSLHYYGEHHFYALAAADQLRAAIGEGGRDE